MEFSKRKFYHLSHGNTVLALHKRPTGKEVGEEDRVRVRRNHTSRHLKMEE